MIQPLEKLPEVLRKNFAENLRVSLVNCISASVFQLLEIGTRPSVYKLPLYKNTWQIWIFQEIPTTTKDLEKRTSKFGYLNSKSRFWAITHSKGIPAFACGIKISLWKLALGWKRCVPALALFGKWCNFWKLARKLLCKSLKFPSKRHGHFSDEVESWRSGTGWPAGADKGLEIEEKSLWYKPDIFQS